MSSVRARSSNHVTLSASETKTATFSFSLLPFVCTRRYNYRVGRTTKYYYSSVDNGFDKRYYIRFSSTAYNKPICCITSTGQLKMQYNTSHARIRRRKREESKREKIAGIFEQIRKQFVTRTLQYRYRTLVIGNVNKFNIRRCPRRISLLSCCDLIRRV